MWLTVEHTTRFVYDGPINEAYTELRLKPAHRDGQRCSSFVLSTEPQGRTVLEYVDRFGNDVHHFDLMEPHVELVVSARSEVSTAESYQAWETEPGLLDRFDYLRPSRYVTLDGSVGELAASAAAEPEALMTAVRGAMVYETGSTDVWTPAGEALESGRGVCQDFAHVMIGAARAHGLPARYVSGYLWDRDRDGDHSASHAWVDIFVECRGWVSLDPTHDREQTGHYVRVGVGRDYADVPPTRGVYKGNAEEILEVTVKLQAL